VSEAHGLSRAAVKLGGDRIQGDLVELAQVGTLGQVLAEQAAGVLVGAALPRATRIAEEDLDTGVDGELGVLSHLSAVVPGEGAAQLAGAGAGRRRSGPVASVRR
jgi:hypothetical protein